MLLIFMLDKRYLLLLFVLFASLEQTFPRPTIASPIKEVSLWSSKCFSNRNFESCRTALEITNTLQSYASSRNHHRCQTSLIALESNLIMSILKTSKRPKVNADAIKEITSACGKIFYDLP